MHIVIDGRLISFLHGIGRYTIALAKGLEKNSNYDISILYNKEKQKVEGLENVNWIKVNCSPFSLREQFEIPRVLKSLSYDIFHVPFFTAPFLVKNLVLTIHDLIPVKFKKEFGLLKYLYFKYYVKFLVNKSKRIITDSYYSKQDIVKFFKVEQNKVAAIHLYNFHIDDFRVNGQGSLTISDKPYFIYVGNKKKYKNVDVAIKSINILNKDKKKAHLVLVGDFEQYKSPDITVFSGISSQALHNLYSNSQALIYPTLYEGFGLPILEAMEAGVPVIASNRSSILEVVGDAGILIEPSPDEFARAMDQILEDVTLRKSLRQKGFDRAKSFNEAKFINQTIEVYNSCIRKN